MSNYKLTYFNGRGRAELTRLVFGAAGTKFEDVRIQKDQWPKLKPETPFGGLPLLEVDGIKLGQSKCIARFVARRHDLAGKTDLEQARADMLIDCLDDAVEPMRKFMFEPDEAKKEEMKKKFFAEQLPTSLAALEKLLKENKGGDGYLVGDALTWADLGVVSLGDWLSIIKSDGEIAKYPKLNALKERVEKLPKVAEYLAKRPKTEF